MYIYTTSYDIKVTPLPEMAGVPKIGSTRPTLQPSIDIWTVSEEDKQRTKYAWLIVCGILGIALLISELYYRCRRIMRRG